MSVAEKLVTVAENVPKVYEAGKKSEYDKFWDIYQDNGERSRYYYAFAGVGWNDNNFKPKYDLILIGSSIYCFTYSKITDLTELLNNAGVKMDTSNAADLRSFFEYSTVTRVPTIDFSGVTTLKNCFYEAKRLTYIEKLVLKASHTFSSVFINCISLKDMTIEGTIGQNGFNVRYSKSLTVASLISILTALSKDSTVASGKSITFATEHQPVIEGDAECLEQLNLAINAGWTIAYA